MKKLTLLTALLLAFSTANAVIPQDIQGRWITSYIGYDDSGFDLKDFTPEQRQALCEDKYYFNDQLDDEQAYHLSRVIGYLTITDNNVTYEGHEDGFEFFVNNAQQSDTHIAGSSRVNFYEHNDEWDDTQYFQFILQQSDQLQFSLTDYLNGDGMAYRCY